MRRYLVQLVVLVLALMAAYHAGYAQGFDETGPMPPERPLPPPRWGDDSPIEKELLAAFERRNQLVDSGDWGLATDDRLRCFRPRHEQLFKQCLNHEAACRELWKRYPGTLIHQANFLYSRSLTDRALYIIVLQDLNDVTGRTSWQRRPGRGEDDAVWLVRSVLDHMGAAEEQIRARFWVDDQEIQHGEWYELGMLCSDFFELRR